MVVAATSPDLFASRLLAHVCAPVFVFLTGLSACLYGSRQGGGRGRPRCSCSSVGASWSRWNSHW